MMLGSSREYLPPPAPGDASEVFSKCRESLVSRRRDCGLLLAGEDSPNALGLPCASDTEVLRNDRVSLGVPSLFWFCVGAFNGELTDVEKS